MKQIVKLIITFMLLAFCSEISAQVNDLLITGIVKSKETRRPLENASISVVGSSIGTVSNADGIFTLKLPRLQAVKGIKISHLGYLNYQLSLEEIEKSGEKIEVWMIPTDLLISEISIYGGTPKSLVEEALSQIPVNYSEEKELFSAFYRETIQKGRRYIGISEAVMDVYKTPYNYRTNYQDRVQIQKGRRLISQKMSDTLAVKLAGGPTQAVQLDFVKNGDFLFDMVSLNYYDFRMESPVILDNRLQYVVSFRPRASLEYALFEGKVFIDQSRLSFTRAEFEVDLSDREKATRSILRRKPTGLRFRPREVSFIITYKQQGDKTYLNYLRNVMRFNCDWKKRLFASTYTVLSEMVMVDRQSQPTERIKYQDSFRDKDIFYDVVGEYWNEDFWRDYNIIEPTESLEHAVGKLRKK
ncbi:MAG: carboxypeptidase-like regulatory domain-containing protein [Mediterranea massiliensis]|nr:carboxypeptidase-like regulatory domain-containing protein [Mediterranea massiliensis]